MSRRRRATKRDILPDAKFGDTVLTRFMNALMYDGKKSSAETIVYSAATEGSAPRIYVIRSDYPEPRPLSAPDMHLLSVSSKDEMAVLVGAAYVGQRLYVGTLARMPLGGGAPREILAGVREAAVVIHRRVNRQAIFETELIIVHAVAGRAVNESGAGGVFNEVVAGKKFSRPRAEGMLVFERREFVAIDRADDLVATPAAFLGNLTQQNVRDEIRVAIRLHERVMKS